jgi:outer membrane protein TolC
MRAGTPAVGAGIGLAALLAMAGGVGGQTPEGPTRLTVDEAIERARLSNPAFQRASGNLELNEIEAREFWLGFLPQPSLSLLSTNMQWNRQAVGTDNFGNPIPNPDFRMIQSARSTQTASLTWNLELQDLFQRRVQRFQADGREVAVRQQRQTLDADVRLTFLDAQERLQALELEEDLLGVRAVNQEITEQLFRLGRTDRPDLLGAELDYVEQEDQLEQSRADLRAALLQLRNLIGDAAIREIEIEPVPLRIFDPSLLDEEALVETAVRSGSRIRQEELSLRQAEERASLRRAEWMPTLRMSALTGRQELSRESAAAFGRPLPDAEWARTISISLDFPDLGRYFTRQTGARRDALEIRNADESLREARFEVEEEVRRFVVDLRSAYRTLVTQERRAELARERLELQQEFFRLGRIDFLQLQSAAESAASAQRQALQARYAFERARVSLERTLGGPLAMPDSPPPAREER